MQGVTGRAAGVSDMAGRRAGQWQGRAWVGGALGLALALTTAGMVGAKQTTPVNKKPVKSTTTTLPVTTTSTTTAPTTTNAPTATSFNKKPVKSTTTTLPVTTTSTTTAPTTTIAPTTTTSPTSTTTTTVPATTTTTAPTSGPGLLTAPAGYATSQLIWQDTFAGTALDTSKWNTYMTSIASNGWPWNAVTVNGTSYSAISPAGSVDAENERGAQVSVNNGLSLSATPSTAVPGYQYVSGVVDTYGKFAWAGGYFQARVELPDTTTGYWPAIWFLPAAGAGTNGDQGEFDLDEGGYTKLGAPNGTVAANLHVAGATQTFVNVGQNFSSSWHTLGAQYVPGVSLTVFVDGVQVARYTTNVPTWPLQLVMDLQVASALTAGWHTTGSPQSGSFRVAEIQFYS